MSLPLGPGSGTPDLSSPITVTGQRARFISRTYTHLLGAVLGFVLVEVAIFQSGAAASIANAMLGTSWLLVLGAFMVVSWLASRAAHTAGSLAVQYAALSAFVLAEAIVFVPLLYVAEAVAPGTIRSAAMATLLGFAALTAVAFVTRKDFSFTRGLLCWGGVLALVAIVGATLLGFELGTWFSMAMIAFAGVAILYDTSNVIHHFPEDRYVAASLELFASVALMFWYILRLFSSRD